ncbi:MAG: hypothetical protein ACFWTZ_05455 [Burkholderia sp.]
MQLGPAADQLVDERHRLAACRAVADRDELAAAALADFAEPADGLLAAAVRLERIDDVLGKELARGVDGGDLDARADARVKPEHGLVARRRGEQQVLEVAAENVDGLRFRLFAQAREDIGLERRGELHLPGPAAAGKQPFVARAAAVGDRETVGDARDRGAPFLVGLPFGERELEHALGAPAEHRERAVRRDAAHRLSVVEIVAELGPFGLLAFGDAAHRLALAPEPAAQLLEQAAVLAHALAEDVARSRKRRGGVGNALFRVHKGRGLRVGIFLGMREKQVRKRLEARLAGDRGSRAALRPVRQVKVLEALLGVGFLDRRLELGRELALGADRLEHRASALVELPQVGKPLFERAQLRVVEAARRLLAVARDEGHRGAAVEQIRGRLHLSGACADLPGDALKDSLLRVFHGENSVVNKRRRPACRAQSAESGGARGGRFSPSRRCAQSPRECAR